MNTTGWRRRSVPHLVLLPQVFCSSIQFYFLFSRKKRRRRRTVCRRWLNEHSVRVKKIIMNRRQSGPRRTLMWLFRSRTKIGHLLLSRLSSRQPNFSSDKDSYLLMPFCLRRRSTVLFHRAPFGLCKGTFPLERYGTGRVSMAHFWSCFDLSAAQIRKLYLKARFY